ncbi:Smr/MutS family protein [Sphingomonas metalli]|uniref:Smr/MutS family protein n=1 Tax=Sphingomonas metalli TaxID=1779358 RepID=UPI0016677CA1|nr:Smr/MutS family protein [Sphingomonas metalli]
MASVRPIRAMAAPAPKMTPASAPAKAVTPPAREPPRMSVRTARTAPTPPRPVAAANTLDASWNRKLTRGIVLPDSSIDLHGHTLASAHALLDQGLDRAIRRGDRVLLLVTGKPPRPDSERPHARGAIRAAVADWIAASRHADAIAAVRGAHPRHGGLGALYIVLRRPRCG